MHLVLPDVEYQGVKKREQQVSRDAALSVNELRKEASTRYAQSLRVKGAYESLQDKDQCQPDGKIKQVEEPLRNSLAFFGRHNQFQEVKDYSQDDYGQ